ncbi:glycosyl transferase [Carnobacterium maltaromaticum]|uniref:glycosyltransferase n=1 Tax=Carnobacterium maltaromaticum TaxID=2751 RepID=UPI000C75E83F|nr:glycosyltransferase [Carnobacterium maltaromaticum]PLS37023.1 glycosyl transferase [Carnobacterium maltaromaticum]PLS37837.1 glycosyl transferase [Carnobacterium maltaromaticum]PLS39778.1 glycosyl transferase [Carnobacterium maltaromaticum]PLS44534.1 glycosyl transferase [Carnobacterium maltaromaticum]PLS46567.1 glycosyl transferase [Carnobacterium maltaromaticum]
MKKRQVLMFVWNHFTNDARVMRSCTTLADNGYFVKLVAIQDKQKKFVKQEQVTPNFLLLRTASSISPFILILSMVAFIYLILLYQHYYLFVGLFLFISFLWHWKKRMFRIVLTFIGMVKAGLFTSCTIVHSNDLNTLLQGVIIKVVKRVPLVYDSHEIHSSRTGYNSKIYEKIERYLIKYADVVIHENDTRAQYIHDLYQIDVKVMHNYTTKKDIVRIQQDLKKMLELPKEELILLYQGGIQEGRGLEQLILAMPKVQKGVLVLIGDGKIKPALKKMVATHNLGDRVYFVDKVPLNMLHQYTQQAFIGFQVLNNVCFNHYSAASNKLFEYIMAEVPVIACDFPEMQKVIKKWQVGILVDSHSSQSISRAVNELICNRETYQLLKENCRVAKEHFNWENEQKVLLDLYKELLK